VSDKPPLYPLLDSQFSAFRAVLHRTG
jgi:hypothetical protein